jgi:hypothetical protein
MKVKIVRMITLAAGALLTPLIALSIFLSAQANASDVWRTGDVLVAVNSGKYQVLRPTGPATGFATSLSLVDTLSDGTNNATGGCTFDSNWRPHVTSFTLVGNPSSLLERYQIRDVNLNVPPPIVAKSETAAGGTAGKSVAIDALGNIYVGHSGGNGEIDAYSPPGPGQAFTSTPLPFATASGLVSPPLLALPPVGAISDGLDVTSQSTANVPNPQRPNFTNYLYFTSGANIYAVTFNLTFVTTPSPRYSITSAVGPPQLVTINYNKFNPNKIVYHGIKIVAGADGTPAGLIAAGELKILQFVLDTPTTAHLAVVYDNGTKPNWQSLTLDPCAGAASCPAYSAPGNSFWATDQSNNQLAHFSVPASLPTSGYVSKSVDFSYSLAPFGSARGVCEVGAVSGGQPRPVMLAHSLTNTALGSTFTYPVPNGFPANFYNPPQPAPNTFTVGALFTDQNPHTVLTKLFSVDFDPSSNAGVADDGKPCLTTAPPPPLGVLSPYCEAYKLELTPTPGTFYSLMDLDVFALQQTTSSEAVTTPPATPGPEPAVTSPKFYHDMKTDLTIALFQDETRIKSGSGSTVFTIQNQTGTGGFSCGYSSPIVQGGTYGLGQNLTFKFQAVGVGSSCGSGPFLTNLLPRLTLVLENPNNSASSTQEPVSTTGCSSQCLNGFYDLNSAKSSWQIQIKTSNLPAGKYIATTIDDSGTIPAFGIEINLQ